MMLVHWMQVVVCVVLRGMYIPLPVDAAVATLHSHEFALLFYFHRAHD